MLKKVLFFSSQLNENNEYKDKDLSLYSLASIANKSGFETKICTNSLNTNLKEYNPDYLIANISALTFSKDIQHLMLSKKEFPNVIIIVYGEPFLIYNTNFIYENPFIDYLIYSEPEFVLKNILSENPDEDILGICYLKNMQGVKNEPRPFIEKLDDIPYPDYDLLNSKKELQIEVSRGCPAIDFCSLTNHMEGGNIRARSVEKVLEEIKNLIKKYKPKKIFLKGEVLNYDNSWVEDFCNLILKSKLKINWEFELRICKFDKSLLNLIKKAGCNSVSINLQALNNECLNNIGAEYSLSDIEQLFIDLKKAKIKTNIFLYVGLPKDTKTSLLEYIKLLKKLKPNSVTFKYPLPLPGTRFFAYTMINRLSDSHLSFENTQDLPIVKTHELSKDEIFNIKKDLMLNFKRSFFDKTCNFDYFKHFCN